MKIPFTLTEPTVSPADHTVTGEITIEANSISLRFNNFGTHDCEGDHGAPVHLELWNGELRLIVFPDINEAEPTVMDLARAKVECWVDPEIKLASDDQMSGR